MHAAVHQASFRTVPSAMNVKHISRLGNHLKDYRGHEGHCMQKRVLTLCVAPSFKTQQLWLSGRIGVAPGVVRRGLLVLLQTVLPYMIDCLGTSADRSELQAHAVDWLHMSDDTSHQQDPVPSQSNAGSV